MQKGIWIEDVEKIFSGASPTLWEDVGMTALMAFFHLIGVPLSATFFCACLFLTGIASVFIFFLQVKAQSWMEGKGAFVLSCLLVLYPPGVYYSFFNVVRILPTHVFLAFCFLFVYSSDVFDTLDWKRVLLLGSFGVYFAFMIIARKSNNVIVAAGLLALAIRLFCDRRRLRPLFLMGLFVAASWVCGWYFSRDHQHLVWHSLYNGLADFDSKYGFRNTDDYSLNAALKENPRLSERVAHPYDNPEYERTLKALYFRSISGDFLWATRTFFLRAMKLVVVPFQGSWVMPVSESIRDRLPKPRDLFSGFFSQKDRFYVAIKTVTAIVDLILVLFGFAMMARWIVSIRERFSVWVPILALLSSVLYIYVVIGTGNRTLYVAGTYVYLFFALDGLRRLYKRMFCHGVIN